MRWENIRTRRWYVIVGVRGRRGVLSGAPFKVLSMSCPFLYCKGVDNETFAIDSRYVDLSSADPAYVRSFKRQWKAECEETSRSITSKKEVVK